MSLRLRNRLSHPIPYPGAELVPCYELAIIEEPDLTSDTCLEEYWDRLFYKVLSPRVGRDPHFTAASRSAPMAPLPPVRAPAHLTNAASPSPEETMTAC